jgi:hypothetical protein
VHAQGEAVSPVDASDQGEKVNSRERQAEAKGAGEAHIERASDGVEDELLAGLLEVLEALGDLITQADTHAVSRSPART